MDGKTILSEILAFYQYKIDNNLCTMEEIEDACKVLEENMVVYGSLDDFAKFYHVPKTNVSATINRKLVAKPTRKVFYPFHKFRKIVPEKWRKEKE